ncbi:MAG: hypothetical protein ABL940_08345, partial [Bacteroidia bacterium]
MKTKFNTLLVCLALYCMALSNSYAQCLPMIKIDGNDIIADENSPSGIKLPSWLAAGQTLAQSQNVYSIAVIEFTINGTALDYSQNKSVTTVQTVPAGKVWKLESIHKDPGVTPTATIYTVPGTYSFTPTCSGIYLISIWGAGGAGGGVCSGGGGGGGFTEGYYYLLSTNTYSLVVGAGGVGGMGMGGTGGNSSFVLVSETISAGGGGGGLNAGIGGFGTIQNGSNGGNSGAGIGGKGGGVFTGGAGGTLTPCSSSGTAGGAGMAPGGGGGG